MSDEQLTTQEWSIAVEAAQRIGRKHPGVDADEVLCEIGEWIAVSWHKILNWRQQDGGLWIYKKAITDAAKDACAKVVRFASDQGIVYDDSRDRHEQSRYSPAELRALIPYAIHDDWWRGKTDGASEGMPKANDPRSVNNWIDSMMDVRDAFFSLSADGQELLRHGAAVAWDWDKLAVRLSSGSAEGARRSAFRQLDRMRDFLGSSSERIYGEYVGTRNNPDYDDYAAAEERRELDEWMS